MSAGDDVRITFDRPHGQYSRWRGKRPDNGQLVEVCGGDFSKYVEVPPNKEQFIAVFSKDKPVGHDSFSLQVQPDPDDRDSTVIGMQIEAPIGFYGNARNFLRELHNNGYRHVRVEY